MQKKEVLINLFKEHGISFHSSSIWYYFISSSSFSAFVLDLVLGFTLDTYTTYTHSKMSACVDLSPSYYFSSSVYKFFWLELNMSNNAIEFFMSSFTRIKIFFFWSLIITFIIFISSSLGKESGLLLFLSWNLFLFNVITFSKLCALSLPLAAFAYQHTTLLIVLLLSFPLLSAPRVSVSWSFSLCFIGSNRLDGRLFDCLCSFLIVEVLNLDLLYGVGIWTSY